MRKATAVPAKGFYSSHMMTPAADWNGYEVTVTMDGVVSPTTIKCMNSSAERAEAHTLRVLRIVYKTEQITVSARLAASVA